MSVVVSVGYVGPPQADPFCCVTRRQIDGFADNPASNVTLTMTSVSQ